MKKIFALILTIFAVMIAGCGDTPTKQENPKPTPTVEKKSDNKILIAYFSRAGDNYEVGVIEKGNTAIVAEMIAESTGGDLFEIKPVKDYPADYTECTEVAKAELQNNARPEIANRIENLDQYDTIFLGYPNWWGNLPMIICTFLESYDFNNKTIIPFCTASADSLTGKEIDIPTYAKGAAIQAGIGIRGKRCQEDPESVRAEVEQWLKDLNF